MSTQARESRFKDLLQPIRELADNWNVDIAAELEDYLEELEGLQVSLDGGKSTVNFSEAALLIQGSACVYSKKVELLYSLVFHTLDMVTSQKRSATATKSSIGPGGEDADVLAMQEEFLELDDVLQEANNIDLVEAEDNDDSVGDGRAARKRSTSSGGSAWYGSRAGRHAPTPRERLGVLQMGQGLGEESYRITSSAMARNGTLIMDVVRPGLLTLSPIVRASPPDTGGLTPVLAHTFVLSPVSERPHAEAPAFSPGGGGDDDNDDGYDGDGAGAGAASSPFTMPAPEADAQQVEQALVHGAAASSGRALRARHSAPADAGAGMFAHAAVAAAAARADPWAQLDPHALDESSAKPFVRGRVPRPLSNASAIAQFGRSGKAPVVAVAAASAATASLGPESSAGLCAPVTGTGASAEFSYLAARLKQKVTRKRFALAKTRQMRGLPSADLLYGHEEGDDDDDEDGAEYMPAHDSPYHAPPSFSPGPDMGGTSGSRAPQQLLRENEGIHHSGGGARAGLSRSLALEAAFAGVNTSLSYEELLKKHIDAFAHGSDVYAIESQLTLRVAEWQERMEPLLRKEETRPEFSIAEYGARVIHTLEDISGVGPVPKARKSTSTTASVAPASVCEFRELTSDCEPFDVARTFLACLQLANDGNVEICSKPADNEGMGTFSVKLLHSEVRVLFAEVH